MSGRRIGIFGGTFDPVHLGHLILAEQCRELGRLDEVWFVPAARPPHKVDVPLTPFAQRVEMLDLAVAGNPAFRIEQSEKDRPGPSFTVDTLEELGRRHSDADFYLLIGSDTLGELHTWHEPARIVGRAALLVVARPGFPVVTQERFREGLGLPEGFPLRVEQIEAPLIHIASRELRSRAAAGRSLRYLVPRAVVVYIQEKRLYRPAPDGD